MDTVSMLCHWPIPHKMASGWLHNTAPPLLQKQAGRERREEQFGWGCQENCCCCSVTCHNLPGSYKTKCHSAGGTEELPSPGRFWEEGWEVSASGLLDQIQVLLVTMSQSGGSLHLFCYWEFLGKMFYWYWIHLKYTRSVLERSRDIATAFEVLTAPSVRCHQEMYMTLFSTR